MTRFKLRYWNENFYTSADELNTAWINGLIQRTVTVTEYGAFYTFSLIDGFEICTIYKDNGFGFSTQAFSTKISDIIVSNKVFKY
jgi:hypothetical protein